MGRCFNFTYLCIHLKFKSRARGLFNNLPNEIPLLLFQLADVETPLFGVTCPSSDIKKYADRAKNYTTVNWPPVIATDNSGMATNVTQHGVPTGNKFYEGRHEVIYNASDAAGNYRICKFHVTVESKPFTLLLSNDRSSSKTNGYFLLSTKKLRVRKTFCDRFRYM